MKVYKYCKTCQKEHLDGYICDTCGNRMFKSAIVITIGDFEGHSWEENEYHFCEYQCLLKFILGELKKLNPRPIITGQ